MFLLEIRKVSLREVNWLGSHVKWEGKAGLELGGVWHQSFNHLVKLPSVMGFRAGITASRLCVMAYIQLKHYSGDKRFYWKWLRLPPLWRLLCNLLNACELRNWWESPANVVEAGSQLAPFISQAMGTLFAGPSLFLLVASLFLRTQPWLHCHYQCLGFSCNRNGIDCSISSSLKRRQLYWSIHTIKFTHCKCTIQWFLVNLRGCTTITTISS